MLWEIRKQEDFRGEKESLTYYVQDNWWTNTVPQAAKRFFKMENQQEKNPASESLS